MEVWPLWPPTLHRPYHPVKHAWKPFSAHREPCPTPACTLAIRLTRLSASFLTLWAASRPLRLSKVPSNRPSADSRSRNHKHVAHVCEIVVIEVAEVIGPRRNGEGLRIAYRAQPAGRPCTTSRDRISGLHLRRRWKCVWYRWER